MKLFLKVTNIEECEDKSGWFAAGIIWYGGGRIGFMTVNCIPVKWGAFTMKDGTPVKIGDKIPFEFQYP